MGQPCKRLSHFSFLDSESLSQENPCHENNTLFSHRYTTHLQATQYIYNNMIDPSVISIELIIAVVMAISIGALFKGMTGVGLPMIAVPALTTILPIEDAVILMVIPGIAANFSLTLKHRKHWRAIQTHKGFLITGFFGALIGTWLLQSISDQILKGILATILGLYLLQYFFKGIKLFKVELLRKFSIAFGALAGLLQGASGISGQIVAPYYHAHELSKEAYAFIVTASFLVFSIAQFSAVTQLDMFTAERIQLSLMALVPTLIFTAVGIKLAGKVSKELFNKVLVGIFIMMEIKLIIGFF